MLTFLIFFQIHAQQDIIKTSFENKIKIDAHEFWGFDAFGYIYYSKNNVLIKEKDKERFEYKNINLGTLKSVDLCNPLRLLLFFETFNSVTTLDNQLNEIQSVDFSMGNNPLNVVATGMASQNQIWCFDNITQRLWFYHLNHRTTKPVAIQMQNKIKAYQSNLNYFYYVDQTNEVFQIDIFGKIISIGTLDEFLKIKFLNENTVVFQDETGLHLINLITKQKKPINLNEKRIESFYIRDQILSIFTGEEINNYTIILP